MSAEPVPPAAADARPGGASDASGADAFVPVARVADLPPGTLLGVTLPDGTAVCLANAGGTVRAVHDSCTHAAFTLSSGELADGQIECAWHGARFDAATGAVRRGPACDPIATYEVRVTDGTIEVGPRRATPRGA